MTGIETAAWKRRKQVRKRRAEEQGWASLAGPVRTYHVDDAPDGQAEAEDGEA